MSVQTRSLNSAVVGGVEIAIAPKTVIAQHIVEGVARGVGGVLVTPNLDHLRMIRRNEELRQAYDAATLRVADGAPVVWAARISGTPLPERASGSDLTLMVAERAAAEPQECKVYMLGGHPGSAEAAAKVLARRFRGLNVVGTRCPPIGFDADEAEMKSILDDIDRSDASIVFLALGAPKQEVVAQTLYKHFPHIWVMCVGGTLDIVAGRFERAPKWMQMWGLEWLYRLKQEPARLFRRYVMEDAPFLPVLLAGALRERFRNRNRFKK